MSIPAEPVKEYSSAGGTFSFYASGLVAAAIRKYLAEKCAPHGEASKWHIEAVQRDLRARGEWDGSLPANEREEAIREFAELLRVAPVADVRERVAEMRMTLAEVAGAASLAGK